MPHLSDDADGRLPAGDTFVIHFDIPGDGSDSIELTVDKDILTVQAGRSGTGGKDDDLVVCERPQGTFQRRCT